MTCTGTYLGHLRTQNTHIASGTTLLTDAPTDNHGKGEAFSPTDLVAAALGSCMITILSIEANRQGFDPVGLAWSITKKMGTAPRAIAEIELVVTWAGGPPLEADIDKLKNAALNCPVALSLHPSLLQNISFLF